MIKKYAGLISTLLLLIVCIFSLGFSSLAWYSMNEQTRVSSMQIYPTDANLNLMYNIYAYNEDLDYVEEVTGKLDTLTLPAYDSVILSRNKNTRLIIKLTVTSTNDVNDLYNLKCIINCLNASLDTKYLSNITYFKSSQIDINSTDPQDIYDAASEAFKDIEEKTFINNGIKSTKIEFDLSSYEVKNSKLIFYVEFDYSQSLIKNISDFNLDDFDINWLYESDLDILEIMQKETD